MKELEHFDNYLNSIMEATPSWKDIYAANKNTISDPNKIYPGQQLQLPGGGTYTVKKGDTLNKIASGTTGQGAMRTTPKGEPALAPSTTTSQLPKTQQAAQSQLQTADDFVRSMANAATFGYADKLAAAMSSKFGGGKDYEAELGKEYGKSAAAGQRSPIASTAGEIAGTVTSPAFAGGAALGTKALSRVAPQAGKLAQFAAGTTGGFAADTAAEKIAQKADPNNPWLKEGNIKMKSKEFIRKKTQEGKASAFGKIVSQLGGGAEALPASVIRRGGQNWEKVGGVSDLKYYNPASREVKSLDDLKKAADPKVFRRGEPPMTPAATTAGTVTTKGGKPLGRGTTAALAALGGGLVGYGLGSGERGEAPMPTPTGPGPTPPRPRPTPARPERDSFNDLVSVKPSGDDTPGSEDWLRRRVNQPTTSTVDTVKPAGAEDPSVTAARAAASEKTAELQRMADVAKAAREKPVASDGQGAKPSIDDNKFSPGSQQWLDKSTKTNESQLNLKTLKFLAGLTKK